MEYELHGQRLGVILCQNEMEILAVELVNENVMKYV
jgi:hypothetical protein